MASVIETGWRTVRPGRCFECGFDDGWQFFGDGAVACACQCCPECNEQPGWHDGQCSALVGG